MYHWLVLFFFFNDPAPPEIYPLPLHAALPISGSARPPIRVATSSDGRPAVSIADFQSEADAETESKERAETKDRKSTRLNSSHLVISYAVFCLKKKKPQTSRSLQSPSSTRPCR